MGKDGRGVVRAAATTDTVISINKNRITWALAEWSEYFKPANSTLPVMTSKEIASGALWLRDHGYPIPTDCPKRHEEPFAGTGGCPDFRPACLLTNTCRVAREMCSAIIDTFTCPTCHNHYPKSSLRDEISRREYEISGMCQKCQDSVFGK